MGNYSLFKIKINVLSLNPNNNNLFVGGKMKNSSENYAFLDYYDNQVRRFENSSKIGNSPAFFNCSCDGFCLECEFMFDCEVYEMIEDEWEGYYS